MIVLKELPKAAAQRLAERGLDVKTALLTMRADLGSDLVLKDVYVALFADRLCVLEGSVVISRPSRLRLADARDREAAFAESKYTEYEKEKLTEVHVETLVSSGLAVGKYDGVETVHRGGVSAYVLLYLVREDIHGELCPLVTLRDSVSEVAAVRR